MIKQQNYMREEVRRLKWEENISYKTIAEDLLCMNYHSFMNWLHEYKNLSSKRIDILKDYVCITKGDNV